jgi:hypothetical protein
MITKITPSKILRLWMNPRLPPSSSAPESREMIDPCTFRRYCYATRQRFDGIDLENLDVSLGP